MHFEYIYNWYIRFIDTIQHIKKESRLYEHSYTTFLG